MAYGTLDKFDSYLETDRDFALGLDPSDKNKSSQLAILVDVCAYVFVHRPLFFMPDANDAQRG